ncbi:citrate synthase [Acidipropionibacterium acidipropionici]|jgi:citrate synthase|uniref:Citrate synthase n=2 Tax=Acidipropionibacterium acidipropionici TaxID=1748 RepID=A0AAC9AMZ4_9ACTN|nr:citrate synthase [Acidipropionibacterium acidipropionici]AFV89891.1 Citrate (Si)-synthase [Acidipropionibacterium acidipropionici ATCC 4875]AMS04750.1 type II citrate synthase [Acidipropionibacterium acidipropionici]AOZ46240.1 citrate (Si)-synthase [Acidipropionibacterium acidipropionici]AZP37733.1 citrate synthase [Acidipropionibacterium acidipropionici]
MDQLVDETCTLTLDGHEYTLPVRTGSTGDRVIDISGLRAATGGVTTFDPSFANTSSCESSISWIDGENGRLTYRGIPIEILASEKVSFVEVAWLLIFGSLPTKAEREHFTELLTEYSSLHRSMDLHFNAFPPNGHPMAIMSSMINAMSTHDRPKITDEMSFTDSAAKLLSKVRTIAAASYKASIGEPAIYPRYDLKYVENFMHMMFSLPYRPFEADPIVARALNLFFVLHADHGQNCSTSTVRMVASSGANLFTSCSAGVCALWGPRHGGANVDAVQALQKIKDSGLTPRQYVARAKDNGERISGFGHRIYRNWDPRARILRGTCSQLLDSLNRTDPLLDIARELEDAVLSDDYFVERRLFPNVDFYSGIVLRALNIPLNMFTVMFAIGRMPGWIAHWREATSDPKGKIARPRDLYVGPDNTAWVPRSQRG